MTLIHSPVSAPTREQTLIQPFLTNSLTNQPGGRQAHDRPLPQRQHHPRQHARAGALPARARGHIMWLKGGKFTLFGLVQTFSF